MGRVQAHVTDSEAQAGRRLETDSVVGVIGERFSASSGSLRVQAPRDSPVFSDRR